MQETSEPVWRSGSSRSYRTPVPSGTFHGRTAEVRELERLVKNNSLVTVLGTAGVGKTRLVREFLRDQTLSRDDRDRSGSFDVRFVSLAAASGPQDIVFRVARVLNLVLDEHRPIDEAISHVGRAMADFESIILVLDNLEHLADSGSVLIERWAEIAPKARFVVTSREPLRLSFETRFELNPLRHEEALELYQSRARAIHPWFSIEPSNQEVIDRTIDLLDGLPLAIELAAARLAVISPQEVCRRLSDRFSLLRGTHRDAPDRHRTLNNAIAWSWSLLTPIEAQTLAQCSVFREGFSLEAAEATVHLEDEGNLDSPLALLDVLQSLREKSLMFSEIVPACTGMRYRLLVSIREYAEERLRTEGNHHSAIKRHAAYFLKFAEAEKTRSQTPQAHLAFERLGLEYANLREAYRRMRTMDPVQAARLALSLDVLLEVRGPYETQVATLSDALQTLPSDHHLELRSSLHLAYGAAQRRAGDLKASFGNLERGLRDAPADSKLRSQLLRQLAGVQMQTGKTKEAEETLEEALRIAQSQRHERTEGLILSSWAELHMLSGQYAQGADYGRRALRIFESLKDDRLRAHTLATLGRFEHEEGDAKEARALWEQAIELHRRFGNLRAEATTLEALANLEQEEGHLARALETRLRTLDICRGLGNRLFEGTTRAYLSLLRAESGDLEDAEAQLAAAVRVAGASPNPWLEGLCILFRGVLVALRGQPGEAVACFSEARSVFSRAERHDGLAALDVFEGFADFARMRSDPDARQKAREVLRQRLSSVAGQPGTGSAGRSRFGLVRLAVRMLRQALVQFGDPDAGIDFGSSPASGPTTLEVGPDGNWFRLAGGNTVDLRRRRALTRILSALVEARLATPQRFLTRDMVFAAGWPGETIRKEVAANRVWVAISTLRKMGLGRFLCSGRDGYYLDPEHELVSSQV